MNKLVRHPLIALFHVFLVFSLLLPGTKSVVGSRGECALSLLASLPEPSDKAEALIEIAKLYLHEGDKESADKLLVEALYWTAQIEEELFKSGAVAEISKVGSIEHVESAAEIAKTLGGSNWAWAARELIGAYARLGLSGRASELLREALAATRSAERKNETWYGDRENELSMILSEGARAGLTEQVWKWRGGIKDEFLQGDVLRAVAVKLVEQHKLERAINVARSIQYEIERIDALVDVANTAAKTGNKSSASQALSFALRETRRDIFDPEQDTKTKALVSISLAYESNEQRARALSVLERAEKVGHTIEKPGFKDSGMSQIALAYARLGIFDQALRVTENIPSPWSDIKVHTLASIAGSMSEAGDREQALSVLDSAFQVAREIDCSYFKYASSARSCFGNKAEDFMAIAAAYGKAGLLEKQEEMLDLAIQQNGYRENPPHPLIEEEFRFSSFGWDRNGELRAAEGYLNAGKFMKAIEVATKIKEGREKVIAVATIELKLRKVKEKTVVELINNKRWFCN